MQSEEQCRQFDKIPVMKMTELKLGEIVMHKPYLFI